MNYKLHSLKCVYFEMCVCVCVCVYQSRRPPHRIQVQLPLLLYCDDNCCVIGRCSSFENTRFHSSLAPVLPQNERVKAPLLHFMQMSAVTIVLIDRQYPQGLEADTCCANSNTTG